MLWAGITAPSLSPYLAKDVCCPYLQRRAYAPGKGTLFFCSSFYKDWKLCYPAYPLTVPPLWVMVSTQDTFCTLSLWYYYTMSLYKIQWAISLYKYTWFCVYCLHNILWYDVIMICYVYYMLCLVYWLHCVLYLLIVYKVLWCMYVCIVYFV